MYYNNILETIGKTPLVKLNKVTAQVKATVLAKIESFNPGNSIKDRIAVKMIEDAEKEGRLKPGGTIIEGTSGNTGMGLALVAVVKGYKCIFTTTDKQSKEKADMLRALNAEVIVCPTNVSADDPRSYYSVASRLSRETPNSIYVNQYDNLSNRKAHYETTGPEIWEQTESKITHLLVGAGTGGTICGTSKYLKEKNPKIKVWAIDTYGSVLKKYHETGKFDEKEIYPYITEGIGEDIVPANYDFKLIDHFEKVTDKDGALMTREIARKEGILVGYSAGSAIAGLIQLKDRLSPKDMVVVIFHDHGSRYVGKIFNDDWMRERGFIETRPICAKDIVSNKVKDDFISLSKDSPITEAVELMQKLNISQIPITENGSVIGSITERTVFSEVLKGTNIKSEKIEKIMKIPFPFVDMNTPLEQLSNMINIENSAVLIKDLNGKTHIITEYDVIHAIAK